MVVEVELKVDVHNAELEQHFQLHQTPSVESHVFAMDENPGK
jgi:hypothetical protein